ncbi:Multifunctional tryptophan biosynthesis protein [Golovinomyces cichoracearum]|uniref:Multifunctional tryptophan biosynthesis protein n=1 Tax=Golovinomyces cichoracearum TaxID=62708 RepID=A0A420IBX0_9PEZI|nr:Multifunctional tryptophan biosynthesis protein [Golovinomyces cichoracearum]
MSAPPVSDLLPKLSVTIAPPVESASNIIVIDNYDSFVWNIYQYLCLEGATVSVYRNNEITLEELDALSPTQLVISPGPGHPQTDSGISRDVISHFAGKIPILGVCMGQQCIIDLWGGEITYAGEIFHGKTSPIQHDGKGIFKGLPQDIHITRYHSLAGTYHTMPDCLEITSWTTKGDKSEKGVIMGVRHKEYVVEGVQFHPESILSQAGNFMLKNFVHLQGGTWAENERLHKKKSSRTENILETIFAQRKLDVSAQKNIPSLRPSDLQAAYDLDILPPLISFVDRLRKSPFPLSLMAEIKRASPSKGIISLATNVPAQAKMYALAGASVISVLTEPKWFKGSIDDLRIVRQALEGMKNRPAVLRKEFIFDEYQVLEARLNGADTILLIVKMLEEERLTRLYRYSQSLGMEPLVEVNTHEEMKTAIKLGSKVIGVNNRNLTSFEVDLNTTIRLLDQVSKDTLVCALSGISEAKDVEAYHKSRVSAVLVGEALMRANHPLDFVHKVFGKSQTVKTLNTSPLLVKICGTRKAEVASEAIKAGADMIGMILVPGRTRCVSSSDAIEISKVVHEARLSVKLAERDIIVDNGESKAIDFFTNSTRFISNNCPLLVGVFQNQPLEEILKLQKAYKLDIVQLHGDEPLEWTTLIPVPVIRSFNPDQSCVGKRGYHALPLLDAGTGGSGNRLNIDDVKAVLSKDPGLSILLAGGLNPENLSDTIRQAGELGERIVGVDVSSGVEENGIQSITKIQKFITIAKRPRESF